jgi:transposase
LRRVAAVAVLLAAIVAGLLAYFAVRGGGGDPAVAHVGREPIRKSQLETVIRHFRLEAQAEGRQFPSESTPAGRHTRDRLLGLLVYRTELRQAARRLGVRVTRVHVLRRLRSASGGEEANPDAFAYGSAEAQLLFESVYRKVTRDVKARTQAELSARKNATMKRFVDRLQRETKVRYEPGYAPGS